MALSYSIKAYPWENACIESFHSLIKREWLSRFTIRHFTHAYHMIFEYIDTFYNTVTVIICRQKILRSYMPKRKTRNTEPLVSKEKTLIFTCAKT